MTKAEAAGNLDAFIAKMQNEGLQPLVIETFAYYFNKLLTGETGLVYDREIQPVEAHEIEDYKNLNKHAAAGQRAFKHSVRIVLNGGLGTTMG